MSNHIREKLEVLENEKQTVLERIHTAKSVNGILRNADAIWATVFLGSGLSDLAIDGLGQNSLWVLLLGGFFTFQWYKRQQDERHDNRRLIDIASEIDAKKKARSD